MLEDNHSVADMIATLQRQECQMAELTATNKMQRTDIESLKKRLEQFGAENDDLLEKLAEMKRDKTRRERQFDEQMKQVADKLRQLEDSHDQKPDNGELLEIKEQLEEAARRHAKQLQLELNIEKQRYAELERTNAKLQSQLEDVQLKLKQSLSEHRIPVTQMHEMQQLNDRVRILTTDLAEARQQLADQASSGSQARQEIELLLQEKAKFEEKQHELSSAMEHLRRKNAISEQQVELFRMQNDKLKRTLETCSITEEDLKKQLHRVIDKNQEMEQLLEQMRAEQNETKRIEKILREELEKMKQAENERTKRETELKCQLTKAREDYNILSSKTLSEIDRQKQESKTVNEEVDKLRKVNMQLENSECQLKAELKEVKMEAETGQRKLQQEIETLRNGMLSSEEACVELRKEREELLEKWVPKKCLQEIETELKHKRKAMDEIEKRIKELHVQQETLQRKSQEREQELNEEIEKLQSILKTKQRELEKAVGKSLELEKKIEKLKEFYDEKEKLFKKEHEELEQTMKKQRDEFQGKMKATEVQHLVEKEHMSKMWNEKEKELKNKMKAIKLEIRAEIDTVKSKCKQLETAHEEKLRKKDEETKRQVNKLKVEIGEKNKLTEETNAKNRDLQKIIDAHVNQTNELETLRSTNEEMKEKVGKLERAVLRLRLDNDELRELKKSQQTVDFSDVQLQLSVLRQALKHQSKTSPRFSVPPIATTQSAGLDHNRLLEEMLQQLLKAPQDDRRSADSTTLAKELEAERRKVRAGSERIAQLEHWLDTIFNDQQLGIGPASVTTSQIALPPLEGAATVQTGGRSKTQMTSKPKPATNKQKQTRRPKRQ